MTTVTIDLGATPEPFDEAAWRRRLTGVERDRYYELMSEMQAAREAARLWDQVEAGIEAYEILTCKAVTA
ncbi:hypothetical protein [Jiangella sp. DSM 45060]|uniref:hypothetical protein n=1 Tax=Jiangella sp. DSM 45060 TaxID=1798224 RepID=UPI00087CB881|nr:hypothetical protein [Jiangella sp. DSM 45060]SDT35617.1 hypothetical protein SAMN04515669_3691 [Jiangella sp. DSM 45060]